MRIEEYLDRFPPRPEQRAVEHLRDKRRDQGSWCGAPLVQVEGPALTCADCWVADDAWRRQQQVLRRMCSER